MRSARPAVALLLAACGGAGATIAPDARSVDARETDASVPRCDVVAAPVGPPTHAAQVVFDETIEGIDIGVAWGSPIAMFADATGALVFGRFRAFHVSSSGEVTLAALYPTSPAGSPSEAWDAAEGTRSYGLISFFGSDGYRFCIAQTDGSVEVCSPLPAIDAPIPQVTFDGAAYHVGVLTSGAVHDLTFDEDGQVLGDAPLWPAFSGEGLQDMTLEQTPVVVADGRHDVGCSTFRSQSDAATQGDDLLPAEFFGVGRPAMAVTPTDARVFYAGECLVGGEHPCSPPQFSDERVAFVARLVDGTVAGTSVVPLGTSGIYVAFADGDDAIVMHFLGADVGLNALASDGTVVVQNNELPLALDLPDAYVENIWAGATIGPRDYLIAYASSGPAGPMTRVARIQLTPI
jgi:hypothetical protein